MRRIYARHSIPAAFSVLALTLVSHAVAEEETVDLQPPTRDYYAYVCAESEDEVSLVRFGPSGLEVTSTVEVGSFPAEIEGPHGINVSPDGRHWYVSVAHGQPYGSIHKYSTGDNEWQESANVGLFPATLDIAGSTGLLYVVNANFYGDHAPSTISVVETGSMTEVAQIDTGVMPHGARLSRDGKKLYSVNMMDDELVEVDALRFEVARRLPLGTKSGHAGMHHGEHAMHGDQAMPDSSEEAAADAGSDTGGADLSHLPLKQKPMKMEIEPSWVSEPTSNGKIYITALSGSRVLEVDLASWKVTRTFETPNGPYNLAVTPDGERLIVTYKKSDSVGIWDLASGEEVARIETTRRIPHGVAVTSDGRYSFVTVEGVGGEPGVVEVIDNLAGVRVAALEIGKQAGGIALWER
ncbi:MAG: YncE family protein [Acidobacteriota bacterium]